LWKVFSDLRVPVIHPGNVKATHSGELVGESLASGTRSGGNDLLGTDSDGDGGNDLGGRNVVVRGGLGGRSAELGDGNGATGSEGVVGGLEQALGGKSEDELASLASIALRDVEVEDGASGAVDSSVVLSAIGLVRGSGVDGDNQVGVLVSSGEVVGADGAGGSCGGRGGCRSLGGSAGNADDGGRGESSGGGAGRLDRAGRGGRNNDNSGAVGVCDL